MSDQEDQDHLAEIKARLEAYNWEDAWALWHWVTRLTQENALLKAEGREFAERCAEIRNGSPNAFYAHVDAFCKTVAAPSA